MHARRLLPPTDEDAATTPDFEEQASAAFYYFSSTPTCDVVNAENVWDIIVRGVSKGKNTLEQGRPVSRFV